MRHVISVVLVVVALLAGGCARTQPPTIVIIPGAWDGPGSWSGVAQGLRAKGHPVTVVQVPTGTSAGPRLDATLSSYADAVAAALPAEGAIVVAHSRSGAILTELAGRKPAGLRAGIFLAAYMPKAGESVYQLAMADKASQLGPHLRPLADGKALTVDPAGFATVFGVTPTAIPAEPVGPLGTPVHARAGDVPGAIAIITTRDAVISPAFQRTMAAGNGIPTVDLDAGHLPYSATEATIALIHRLAEQ